MLDELPIPIVQAPLAGGPSTPALAGAVSEAGGLGFVAAGYCAPDVLMRDIAATRELTKRPFGVNVFAPVPGPADAEVVERYTVALQPEAHWAGVELGRPRFDDDGFEEKLRILREDPVAVVSFTFGCPPPKVTASIKQAGSEVWITITDVGEAEQAEAAGASALVVQGNEAGGHRGSFADRPVTADYSVLALLQLVGARVRIPLVAAGGIGTGAAIAAVLAAGASAAQLGTAFMRCPEAGTSPVHREALASSRPTALTRVFSGRLARGVVNRLMCEYEARAPLAYPEVHHLTSPLRAYGRREGDADLVNLWAGQAHELTAEIPAAQLISKLHRDALQALSVARTHLEKPLPQGERLTEAK
ncbi:MAG TPA: nitronate monooxygenase [Chloroflexota bacterium]